MESSIFVKILGDSSKSRVLEYLITTKGLQVHQSDVLRNSGSSKITVMRIWKDLIDNKLLLYERTIGRAKLYSLNIKDLRVKKLIELYNVCLKKEAEIGSIESQNLEEEIKGNKLIIEKDL
nr:hypothetical protein [Candidatus Woesearchaeota archaeon]